MTTVISLDDLRKNLSDIAGRVMYRNDTVVVKKYNRSGMVLISESEYEKLEKLTDPRKRFAKEEWDEKFVLMDKVRDRMTNEDQEELEKILDREIKAVRAKLRKKKA